MFLLLLSAEGGNETRMFKQFESTTGISDAILTFYEEYLQANQPGDTDNIEFSSDDLFEFMDKYFVEMVVLAKDKRFEDLWTPYPTSWIKEAIYLSLRESVNE